MRDLLLRVAMVSALVLPLGCSDPLSRQTTRALREQTLESLRREVRGAGPGHMATTESVATDSYLARQPERIRQLDAETGPGTLRDRPVDAGPALDNEPADSVQLSLEQAIRMAVRNNLDVKLARLQPAILEAEVAAAEAAFDAVFFTEGSWNKIDRPQAQRIIIQPSPDPAGGLPPVRVPVGVSSQVADVANLTTGIRKPLGTGGTIVASTGFEYSNNKTPDIILSPDPSWATNVTLGIEQPLLRNFSTDIARTEIALSRNAHRRELLNLHAQLLRTVSEVEAAYWQLAFARRILAVRHGLLAMTRETRDIVMDRGAIDALAPQQAESQSFVEAARAEVVRASINIRVASDRLKQLINDPGLPISGETLIIPIDEPVEVPVEYSLLDAVMAGMRNRPESRQALLNIDDASLRLKFFDNQRLPNLVVNAQLQYHGLNDDDRRVYNSYGNLTDGDFIEYLIGAQFEAPIGNRRARAVYQRSRLERQARIVELERTMQAILLDVKEWLREQQSAYQRIHVERDARRAAAEYLRTLTLRVQQIEGLTPGHVDQRLRAQQQLANAQLRELEAIVQYNVAIMQVRRAQGTLLEHNNIEMQWPDDMFADR